MFEKPFIVRSTLTLRNSDKRRLLVRAKCGDEISKNAQAVHLKVLNYKDIPIDIYYFDKTPLFYEIDGDRNLYPSVYLTWLSPSSFPNLLIHEQVMKYIRNGACLMLQGVIHSRGSFPEFQSHSCVTVSCLRNDGSAYGPVAVGLTLMSSTEMVASKMKGPGVDILHICGDHLWQQGTRKHVPEDLVNRRSAFASLTADDFPPLTAQSSAKVTVVAAAVSQFDKMEMAENEASRSATVANEPCESEEMYRVGGGESVSEQHFDPESMDELLRRCFLAALKYRVGMKFMLPLNVGEFYSRFLLPCVPKSKRIDMKKTTFKKFLTYIADINRSDGSELLKIDSKKKGSELISEVDWNHRLLIDFKLRDEVVKDEETTDSKSIEVNETFSLTEPIMPIFSHMRHRKGDMLSRKQLSELINSYIEQKKLVQKDMVHLSDPILRMVSTLQVETCTRGRLIEAIISRATRTYIINFPDGRSVVRKKVLPKINFKIENRPGNRKVTLVDNLETYGIDCLRFCQQLQTGAATSATLVKNAQQCDGSRVIVQGNQIKFISELLCSEYGLKKNFMDGLQLIPKSRK